MKNNKKIVLLLTMLSVVTFAITSYAISNQEDKNEIPIEVRAAAEEGLKKLAIIVSNDLEKFEFSENDLDGIKLQKGYEVYFIDKDKFEKEEKLEKMLFKSNMWEFVVECNGSPKTFLTVGLEDGEYKMLHFGGDSKEFQQKTNEYIVTNRQKLINIRGKYFVLNEGVNSHVLPCFEENVSWLINENSGRKLSYTSDEFVKILKENVKKNKEEEMKYGD